MALHPRISFSSYLPPLDFKNPALTVCTINVTVILRSFCNLMETSAGAHLVYFMFFERVRNYNREGGL
jgi:hypothetical protein